MDFLLSPMMILILCIAFVFPCQLWLCFKVRSVTVRLLPLVTFLILTVIFAILMANATGWDGLGYFFLALLTAVLLGVCGLCWVIFGIVKWIKRKRRWDFQRYSKRSAFFRHSFFIKSCNCFCYFVARVDKKKWIFWDGGGEYGRKRVENGEKGIERGRYYGKFLACKGVKLLRIKIRPTIILSCLGGKD